MLAYRFWNEFFHSRVGEDAFILGGLLRIGFGLVMLYDRLILGFDIQDFFTPKHSALPLSVGRDHEDLADSMPTLFELFPDSDIFMWVVFWVGHLQAALLVLGVLPRVQLMGLFVNIMSFQNHNALFWDDQDKLFRIWCFLLMFLPLHRVTVYDFFRGQVSDSTEGKQTSSSQRSPNERDSSWPVWPFRLFQIQLTVMYMSLSLHKLQSSEWISGEALYWLQDSMPFAAGSWLPLPEVVFNRMMPIQLLSWLVVGLELSCWITMWFPSAKRQTAFCMIAFNVSTELMLNQHCLPWLTILGWAATLFQEPTVPNKLKTPDNQGQLECASPKPSIQQSVLQMLSKYKPEVQFVTDACLLLGLLAFCIDALPVKCIESFFFSDTTILSQTQDYLYAKIEPTLCIMGLWQEPWNLYASGGETPTYHNLLFGMDLYRWHLAADSHDAEFVEKEYIEFPSPASAKTMWERKRYARLYSYFSNLNDVTSSQAWITLGDSVADQQYRSSSEKRNKDNKDTVTALEMFVQWSGSSQPAAPRWSWNVPARDDSTYFEADTSVMKVRYCTDLIPKTEMFPDTFCNDCWSDLELVHKHCRASCEVCVSHSAEFGHHYLEYPMSSYTEEDCVHESDEDWDPFECPGYKYYRDLPLVEATHAVDSISLHRTHYSEVEENPNFREPSIPGDSAKRAADLVDKTANHTSSSTNTQKVPQRTVLKSM